MGGTNNQNPNGDGEEDFFDFVGGFTSEHNPSKEELTVWLSEFMGKTQEAAGMYRQNFCSMVADRLWEEFGVEGMCELMMAIDKRAGWISDIIIEDADLHDSLFAGYGVFDNDAIYKARMSNQLTELNKKIWRLRKKYSKLIAEEIYTNTLPTSPATEKE
jgi:hypothetical protein